MSFLSVVGTAVDRMGLRRSRMGRKLIAHLNVLGEHAVRRLYLNRKTPRLVDGHRMYLSDRHAPSLAFVNGVLRNGYEADSKSLLEGLIQEGMTIFDVGAHVGTYTLMAARLTGPTGHVYAFEAEPENYSILKKNVELNGYQNVTCVPKAVSNRSGLLTLYVSSQGNDRHTLIGSSTAEGQGTPCEVETISLDEFSASIEWPRVDVVKMDIEGAEPMAIEGMSELFRRSENLSLVMEFAPDILRASGVNPEDFLTLLASLGFCIAPVESTFPKQLLQPERFGSAVPEIEKLGAINLFCRRDSVDRTALNHENALRQHP